MDFYIINLVNLINDHKLYGIATKDLWATQNAIVAYFLNQYQWSMEDVFTIVENPGIVYLNSLNKTQKQSWEDKKLICLTAPLYNKYYFILKGLGCYIFLLDHSVYGFNTVEDLLIIDMPLENDENYSINQYCQLHHHDYHQDILHHCFKKSSMDWEYLRKNWDFLHWFVGYWLSEYLIKNTHSDWDYGYSLAFLIEYYPCLYSFFPDKKVLTCNYIYNMVINCKKN
jgi:hypothetical protein